MTHTVSAAIHFLEDDALYQSEKPYLIVFEPAEGIPKSNLTLHEQRDILIEDIRGREEEHSFSQTGFAVLNIQSQLLYEDFTDAGKIKSFYLREVAEALRSFLNATRVQIYEHLLRRTHQSFPISTGEPYEYDQPTTIAHIDTTCEWTTQLVERLNQGQANELLRGRVQAINVWKPLRGPVRDWPLALCDRSTVDSARHVKFSDLVYANETVENCQIHHASEQKWYYLSNQQPTEAWIFLQSDSIDKNRAGVPHTSFKLQQHQGLDNERLRESIEVRALVYYNDSPNTDI